MVMGIGTDIMRIGGLHAPYLTEGDPFFEAAFSPAEMLEAARRTSPYRFYSMRFCGKEAVFKALGISPEGVRFCEIEILSDEFGAPTVTLLGALRARAQERGVTRILLSLSSDGELVQATVVALSS